MKSDIQELADSVALMELCAQLEAEQQRIFEALPALKASFDKEAKAEYAKLSDRAAAIEKQIGEIADTVAKSSDAQKAQFAQLERAIKAKGAELAEYSKRLESEIPKPVEEKIKAMFAAIPMPKNGEPGRAGKDASLLTGFKGNWRDDVTYKAGEWFTFRGSSYLVLRDARGQIPTKITQTGESAYYAVFAMSGAPGLPAVGVTAGVKPSVAVTGTAIDCNLGDAFYATLAANTTFTFSNFSDGQTIVVAVTNTASNYTVTWTGVTFPGGIQPVQTVGAHTDVWTFCKINSVIYGTAIQNY